MTRRRWGSSAISFLGRRGQFHKTLRQMRLAERVNQSEVQRAAYLFVARNTQFPWGMRLTAQLAFNNRVLFPKFSSPRHWAPRCIATNSRRKPTSFTGNLERSEFKEAFIEGRVPGYERAHWSQNEHRARPDSSRASVSVKWLQCR